MGTWLTDVMVLSTVVIFAGVLCLLPTMQWDSMGKSIKRLFERKSTGEYGRFLDPDLVDADQMVVK